LEDRQSIHPRKTSLDNLIKLHQKQESKTKMTVSYSSSLESAFPGTSGPEFFEALLSEHGCRRILEIGSGANPTFPPGYVEANGLSYVTSDVSPEELEKADSAYERLVLDLSVDAIDPALLGSFDCILSRMVSEHIRDGRQYHANLYKMLRPGGISVHSFSTLWSVPFVANRLLPETLTNRLLNLFLPRDRHRHEKFRAYYSWSRGPSRAMIRRFEALGFEVLQYTGYFGHPYYSGKLPWLHRLEIQKSRFLLKHPIPALCAYATIVLRKPKGKLASHPVHPEVPCSTPS
jgi:SAM-dependent methyltransferase